GVRKCNYVDVGRVHPAPPIGGCFGPTVFRCSFGYAGSVPADEHLLLEGRDVEEIGHISPRVRVGLAHEGVTDGGDTQGCFFHCGSPCRASALPRACSWSERLAVMARAALTAVMV